jgi:hypothetical protein
MKSGWEMQAGIENRGKMGKACNCEREYFSIGIAKRDGKEPNGSRG